jgi:hypothetical protein
MIECPVLKVKTILNTIKTTATAVLQDEKSALAELPSALVFLANCISSSLHSI